MSQVRNAIVLLLIAAFLIGAPALAESSYVPDANHPREQVPDVFKWDLGALFASDEAWTAEVATLEKALPELVAYRGTLADPARLAAGLALYFDLHDRINHTTLYANLTLKTDTRDERAQAMQQRSIALMERFMREAGFVRDELLALDDAALAKAYASQAALGEHKVYIDNLRRRRSRVLGAEAERVLALLGDNLWAEIDLNELPSGHEDTFGAMMTDIPWPKIHDENGKEVQLTLSNYGRYRASKKREVRREAVAAFFKTLRQYEHVLASTLASQYEYSVALARARGYDTAIEAYLDKDQLVPEVYENLIATVNANLEPLHRYVAFRKKRMGIEDIHIYDLYTPLVASVDTNVPFEKARSTILRGLEPLGADYIAMLEEGLEPKNGWLDLYPNVGKDSGASSSNVYGRHPFIQMNYQDSVDDMFTLAHEYGHALHSKLAMERQGYSSFRYVPFLAEIASTCNEALLGDHLIASAQERDLKAALLAERLESIRSTIYRQTLFAEFERVVHGYVESGTPVTASLLEKTYRDLVQRYYGPEFTLDENDGMEWAYIPHFYYKYYVFTYATGLSSGIALAKKIETEGEPAAKAFLGMLEGGCSKPPLELLAGAGVDLTKPDAIEAALATFDETLRELETLLAE